MKLNTIARQLASITASGSFAARRFAPTKDLRLEVRGVGPIRLPVSAATARKLCAVARPARHGYKDETRLDSSIRDTWEIAKSRIAIDARSWKRTLAPQLEKIRGDLGLPEGSRLKAELHNMLVYAPGQFFVSHQDSEKSDDMIGTLVVSLPSKFTGGGMVIEHQGEKVVSGGSAKQLSLVAFYADCRHEVRPVKQGYRVVLTYNLTLEGGTAATVPSARVSALAESVRHFFAVPRRSGPAAGALMPPDRLVYLLDHEYTQRGLAWNRLKNADAARASALQDVARELDCEIGLALADVHETWECEDDHGGYYGRRDRRSWYYADDDDDEDYEDDYEDDEPGDRAEPELGDLLDGGVELRHWAGSVRPPAGMQGDVADGELCYTKPSSDFQPFKSEHEGYMGNWGNTVDRWYHRAAIVLWPRERTFVIRAKSSPAWALGEIAKKLRANNVEQAGQLAQRLLPFWSYAISEDEGPELLARTLEVAVKLDDKAISAALLKPFTLTALKPKAAPQLTALLDRHGLRWLRAILQQWASTRRYEPSEARLAWIASGLPALCRALAQAKSTTDPHAGQKLARSVLAEQWAWTLDRVKALREQPSPKARAKRASGMARPILALIDCSRITGDADLHGRICDFLITSSADFPLELPLGVLRAAHRGRSTGALPGLSLRPIHEHCSRELAARLKAPVKGKDDWSIADPLRCTCALCRTLGKFLRAADEIRFEWPLAKDSRAHVHRIIDDHELPVRHTTRRAGRPFTLVLEKTAGVRERAPAERRFWVTELDWLIETGAEF